MKYLIFITFGCIGYTVGSVDVNGTVYLVDGQLQFKSDVVDKQGLSFGIFRDGLMENGWGVLDLKTTAQGSSFEDMSIVMRAAGYLEGYLTYEHIYNQYLNIRYRYLTNLTDHGLANLKTFISKQELFIMSGGAIHRGDVLWDTYSLIYSQYTGLKEGYNAAAPKNMQLDDFAFVILNWSGDLLDLVPLFEPALRPDYKSMSKKEFYNYIHKNSRCSALIKVLPGYENIFFSHATWFIYTSMDRIYKYYHLDIPFFASKTVSFSSYPGMIESQDDFYMMGNGLVMISTSNDIFNDTLFDLVNPETIPTWMRTVTSNLLANNASHWGQVFTPYNAGVYNNQYMILDMNKVKIKETIEDEAFYVVEQIPGLVISEEQTDMLRNGHWPSYNIPFYELIYNLSGYPDQVDENGYDASYQLAPRAKIFRRDAAKVSDMTSMKNIIRYNDYKNEPYSEGDSCSTICCRGELNSYPTPNGCYDAKVADYNMAAQQAVWAINGPAFGGNSNIPPYNWNQYPNLSHAGLPQTYKFDWVPIKPLV